LIKHDRDGRFVATFAVLDCYTEPLTRALSPDLLGTDASYDYGDGNHLTGEPFDVVSMQFCIHYAFETEQKTRCMLEVQNLCNASTYFTGAG